MPIMLEKLYDALRVGNVPETLRLHTWILSFNTALIIAIAGKLFLH